MIVIIYGKEGSSKTRRAKELLAYYKCKRLVDNWGGKVQLQDGDLALTNINPPYKQMNSVHIVSIETAKLRITERGQ